MKILRSASEAGRLFPGPVITIGKFDAFHRGHKKVLGQAVARAKALKTGCVVVTFDPTPDQYLRLELGKPVLTLAGKLDHFRKLGVDAVLLLAFDERLACLTPEAFVRTVLEQRLRPISIFVGADFCFGKDRAGTVATLESLGKDAGFTVQAVPLLKEGGEKISATRIRALIDQGKRASAERLLGRKLQKTAS
jgi:riboflavin kinase/FMN adenylyltransferase